MTDNQRKAYDELSQYNEAKKDIRHLQQKLEQHEAKVHRSTRACDSIMQETMINGMAVTVPMVVQTSCSNPMEHLLDALMDLRIHYVGKQAEAERLCMAIEINIGARCCDRHARLLRNYFVYNQRLEKIAVDEGYCYRQAQRIRMRALEEYGRGMG